MSEEADVEQGWSKVVRLIFNVTRFASILVCTVFHKNEIRCCEPLLSSNYIVRKNVLMRRLLVCSSCKVLWWKIDLQFYHAVCFNILTSPGNASHTLTHKFDQRIKLKEEVEATCNLIYNFTNQNDILSPTSPTAWKGTRLPSVVISFTTGKYGMCRLLWKRSC